MSQDNKLPLNGVRVLAVEQYVAAPFCTMWLADNGAEVIKIEAPGKGDPRRSFTVMLGVEEKISGGFLELNRNKKSVSLNLKAEKGKAIFKELAKHSDVIVENLAPGTMKRLGLDYDSIKEVNAKIIYASISGFGKSDEYNGPYADYPAFDAVLQGMGGLMMQTGLKAESPLLGLAGTVDRITSMATAFAITSALYYREKTGLGKCIDMGMYDVALAFNGSAIAHYSYTGEVLTAGIEQIYAPAGAIKTKNGYVSIILPPGPMWQKFCEAIGHPEFIDHPKIKEHKNRTENYQKHFEPAVNKWMQKHTSNEVVEILTRHGIPVGKVQNSKDIFECPQVEARKMLIEIEDPAAGKQKLVDCPVRFTDTSKDRNHKTAPRLGEHTEEILKGVLNYDESSVEELTKEGLVEKYK